MILTSSELLSVIFLKFCIFRLQKAQHSHNTNIKVWRVQKKKIGQMGWGYIVIFRIYITKLQTLTVHSISKEMFPEKLLFFVCTHYLNILNSLNMKLQVADCILACVCSTFMEGIQKIISLKRIFFFVNFTILHPFYFMSFYKLFLVIVYSFN